MSLIEKMKAELEWLGTEFYQLSCSVEIDRSCSSDEDRRLAADRQRAEKAIAAAQAALTAMLEGFGGDGVQQCDRDATKSLLGRDDAGPSWWSIDSGNADSDPLVQAFAYHRSTAAAAERARMGWQPIGTAPEYEDVLLCIPRYGIAPDFSEMAVGELREGKWYSCDSDDECYVLHQPTHWMPLPAPPADAIERGEL